MEEKVTPLEQLRKELLTAIDKYESENTDYAVTGINIVRLVKQDFEKKLIRLEIAAKND